MDELSPLQYSFAYSLTANFSDAIAITGFSGDAIIRIACAVLTPLTQPVFIFELIWSWRVALTPVPGAH